MSHVRRTQDSWIMNHLLKSIDIQQGWGPTFNYFLHVTHWQIKSRGLSIRRQGQTSFGHSQGPEVDIKSLAYFTHPQISTRGHSLMFRYWGVIQKCSWTYQCYGDMISMFLWHHRLGYRPPGGLYNQDTQVVCQSHTWLYLYKICTERKKTQVLCLCPWQSKQDGKKNQI